RDAKQLRVGSAIGAALGGGGCAARGADQRADVDVARGDDAVERRAQLLVFLQRDEALQVRFGRAAVGDRRLQRRLRAQVFLFLLVGVLARRGVLLHQRSIALPRDPREIDASARVGYGCGGLAR